MNNRKFLITLVIVLFLVTVSCGGGGDSDGDETNPSPEIKTGTFVDSPVAGLGFRSATLSGVTDVDGHFQYTPGEIVDFFIGDISLGSATATDIVTPLMLANTSDMNNIQVINTVRLLQSLDSDNDQTNSITITEQARTAASGVVLDIASTSFETDSNLVSYLSRAGGNTDLVPTEQAVAHFESALGLSSGTESISGTITLPAQATDKKWAVIVDDDHDGKNGWTASTAGTVTGSKLIYSVNKIPAGKYFVYASVKMSESGEDTWQGAWKKGDYVGDGCMQDGNVCQVTIDSSQAVNFTLRVFDFYRLSGTVTSAGIGMQDVLVTLNNSSTATTDAGGNYIFTGLTDGSYTIIPSKSGYTFSPISSSQTVGGASATGVNFTVATSPINIAGIWTWNEKQIKVIKNACAPIGQIDTYTIEIQQNGDQITISVPGSIDGNTISAEGTFQTNGISVTQTISLTVTEDGSSLTGTLIQESDVVCTGVFEITATKNP